MATKAELEALLARVEAATGADREIDAEIAVTFSGDLGAWVVNPSPQSIFEPQPGWWRTSDDVSHRAPDVTASLDAALALVERVLPGCRVMVERGFDGFGWAMVHTKPGEPRDMTDAATPALAILAALLRAVLATHDGGER